MTLDELRQQLGDQLAQAEQAEDAARAALRRAELDAAFLRGQLAGLARITVEERPAYSEGADPPAEPPARGQFLDG